MLTTLDQWHPGGLFGTPLHRPNRRSILVVSTCEDGRLCKLLFAFKHEFESALNCIVQPRLIYSMKQFGITADAIPEGKLYGRHDMHADIHWEDCSHLHFKGNIQSITYLFHYLPLIFTLMTQSGRRDYPYGCMAHGA